MSEELTRTTGTENRIAPANGHFIQFPGFHRKELTEEFTEKTAEDTVHRSEAILSRMVVAEAIKKTFADIANESPDAMFASAEKFESLEKNPSEIVYEHISRLLTTLELDKDKALQTKDARSIAQISYAIEEVNDWRTAFYGTEDFWKILHGKALDKKKNPPSILSMMGFVSFDLNHKAYIAEWAYEGKTKLLNPNKSLMAAAARTWNGTNNHELYKPTKYYFRATNELSRNAFATNASENEVELRMNVAKQGTKEPLWTYYSIDMPEELISEIALINNRKMLTAYDKCILERLTALYIAGNRDITINHLTESAKKKNPSPDQKERARTSVNKMISTTINYDNSEEVEKGHYNYPLHKKEHAPLLPATLSNDTIHMYDIPAIYKIAAERKNVTSFEASLIVNIPLDFTDRNCGIIDYMLYRIGMMRHFAKEAARKNKEPMGTYTDTITFDDLLEYIALDDEQIEKDKHNPSRTRTPLEVLLKYFQNPAEYDSPAKPIIAKWSRKTESKKVNDKTVIKNTADYKVTIICQSKDEEDEAKESLKKAFRILPPKKSECRDSVGEM